MAAVRKWTGRESRALREAMRVSQRDFSELLGVTGRTVSKWESGGTGIVPRPDSQAILDTKFRQVSDEVRTRFYLILGVPMEDDKDASAEMAVTEPLPPQGTYPPTSQATSPNPLEIESLRQEMDEIFRSAVSESSIEEWEKIAIRYARATRDRAAIVLLGDLNQELAELTRIIQNQLNTSTLRRLTRVSAQMSGLMCLAFCLLDDRRSFRKWARTATLAGNESGDSEVLSWVLAQESYGHYYSGDMSEAIDISRHATEVVKVPCTGAALASALEARACAITGKHTQARNALSRAESILSLLDEEVLIPSAFGYNEASFRFHEGNAYMHMRDVKSAMHAQDRALELCAPDNYADWAMTRLDRAQCLVYSGDVSSGLQYASETITSLAPAQRRGIIALRGQEVSEALPESEKKLTGARDFRELLAVSARE
jgi:transcriptional regulator with XRE-family HTH domain